MVDLSRRIIDHYTICVVKTKALISCAVTAQLICAFVFAYADCWFSDVVAQLWHMYRFYNRLVCFRTKRMTRAAVVHPQPKILV